MIWWRYDDGDGDNDGNNDNDDNNSDNNNDDKNNDTYNQRKIYPLMDYFMYFPDHRWVLCLHVFFFLWWLSSLPPIINFSESLNY